VCVGEQLAVGGGSGGREAWMASGETAESCVCVEAPTGVHACARSVLEFVAHAQVWPGH
jgi:hypothetical protein